LGPDEAGFAACPAVGSGTTAACQTPLTPANFGALTTVSLHGEESGFAAAQPNLTFASLPLSFMGSQINTIIQADQNPTADLLDVQGDIAEIASKDAVVNWGWYQQGYDTEPFDGKATVDTFPSDTPHPSYIVHHNGPQYFGYVGDNTVEQTHLHGLQDFYTTISNQTLAGPGVYYVRGGYFNNDGLVAADPNPNVKAVFAGNDDHGSYSDSQIAEAMLADNINAITSSPYWPQSAIIITYDESDGFFDHVPASIRTIDPTGTPETGGPRIPTIVLSPFAASHVVSHVYSEHGSVVKFINELFNLVPLNRLPNEVAGRKKGLANLGQANLGPNDGPGVGDLLEAFDNDRLLGTKPVIPASAVSIPAATAHTLPHYAGAGCSTVGITPTDYPNGYGVGTENDPPPADFNPRPTVSVGVVTGAQAAGTSYPQNIPTSGSWSQ
jgi:phospholipase C